MFEQALAKLKSNKSKLKFACPEIVKLPSQKGEFTLGSSTMNEYSHINEMGNISHIENPSFKNYPCGQDSFSKSIKTLYNSIKTDNLSKQSEFSILKDLNQAALINSESFVNDKLAEIENKVNMLKKTSI